MKPWTTLDRALTPDGTTISLHEHDGAYAIRVDGRELMSTRQHASEEKLAQLACAHISGKRGAGKRGARVLIGGLGFGFTLRAALATLPSSATVVVAEILDAVIGWNRTLLPPVDDPRAVMAHRDVRDAIAGEPNGFDAIVLDVDNGPAALTSEGNAGLYDLAGLSLIRRALRPKGCVGFWSAAPDASFEKRLAEAGFRAEVVTCRARPNAGSWHTLYFGRLS